MPITITVPTPGSPIGPGVQLDVSTDFIGPIPAGSRWIFTLRPATSNPSEIPIGEEFFVSQSPRLAPKFWVDGGTKVRHSEQASVTDGTSVKLDVEFVDNNQVPIDISGQVVGPFSSTAGELWKPQYFPQPGQGLTPVEAQQLQELHDAQVPTINLDALLLPEITNGPQGGFVNFTLPDPVFGLLVQIANVPPELIPDTPDGDYWFPSLAVVRLFRGDVLWLRIPIHTSNKLIGLLDQNLTLGVSALTSTLWSLKLTVQVSFREGVTGQVFLMRIP